MTVLSRGRVVRVPVVEPTEGEGWLGEQAIFEIGDIMRIEEIISAIKNYDVDKIISLASLLASEAEKNLHLSVRVNALGVNNVFEAARLCGIKRVLYSSSIGVYGNVKCYGDSPAREVMENSSRPNTFMVQPSSSMSS